MSIGFSLDVLDEIPDEIRNDRFPDLRLARDRAANTESIQHKRSLQTSVSARNDKIRIHFHYLVESARLRRSSSIASFRSRCKTLTSRSVLIVISDGGIFSICEMSVTV